MILVDESRFISFCNYLSKNNTLHYRLEIYSIDGNKILSINLEDCSSAAYYFAGNVYYILRNGKVFLFPISKNDLCPISKNEPKLLYQQTAINKEIVLTDFQGYELLVDSNWLICYSNEGVEVRNRETMQLVYHFLFKNQTIINSLQLHHGQLYWVSHNYVDKITSFYCWNLYNNKIIKHELPCIADCFVTSFTKCYFFC
jgi:hypothetical protein